MILDNDLHSRRKFLTTLGRAAAVGLLPRAVRRAAAQQAVGTEPEKPQIDEARYPPAWITPPQGSVPEWARPGKVRFTRWDGGALEAAKAILSGWPQFVSPNPDYLDSMVRWYDLRTIDLLRQANINLIWVTFSTGFSNESEREQQQVLRTYIAECHRHGIRTMAYESLTNIFSEDMFERVPESRHWLALDTRGNSVPYNAANYKAVGRITRYLADLRNPAWIAYVKNRIDLAIAAGADGIMYDNCMGPALLETIPSLMSYALASKPDFLIMANFHREQFTYNHMLNAITTEEGGEAGIFSGTIMAATNNRWQKERNTMLPLDGGFLANNLGRMRILWNLSRNWRPCMVESRQREAAGMAETRIILPSRQKLIMAENLMFNCAYEPSVEIEFALGLARKAPQAMEAWHAIASYNQFASEQERHYVGAQSCASLAIVLDNRSDGIAMLNGLAARNIQFDVLYEDQLSPKLLERYKAIALLNAVMVRDAAIACMKEYAEAGGRVCVAEDSLTKDEKGRIRDRPSWIGQTPDTPYWKKLPSVDALAATLSAHSEAAALPPGVLYTVTQQTSPARRIIHLANYTGKVSEACTFHFDRNVSSCNLFSPDSQKQVATLTTRAGKTTIVVPHVAIYSILVLELV